MMNLARSSILLGLLALAQRPLLAADDVAKNRLADFPTANLPVTGALEIGWDPHMIPFIHAARDEDVPFALGLVHAHLRLAQLEFMRYAAFGRLSELLGPFTVGIDHTMRIFDPGRRRNDIIAAMPEATRTWAERFVLGLNTYVQRNPNAIPPDLRAVGVTKLVPWTLEDLVTVWRLTAFDINWAPYLYYLRSKPADRDRVWRMSVEAGLQSVPSFTTADDPLGRRLFDFARIGSNSLVIGGKKTKTGAGLIMNDPHLGLTIPNVWLIAGFESPSYHAVGFMLPSLPFLALGRNPKLAWGGTNMWGLSTYLYELDDAAVKAAEVRTEHLKVRGWFDRDVKIRTTAVGPILSDSPWVAWTGKPLAVKWVGHEVSDELTAFLKANRAKTVDEFKTAFKTYAVSAMNMLATDQTGNIAHVLAYRRPIRPIESNRDPVQPMSNLWTRTEAPTELPSAKNPAAGFLASANNQPFAGAPPVGWFFQSNDRIARLQELATPARNVDVAKIKLWQRDTFSHTGLALKDVLVEKIRASGMEKEISRDKAWRRVVEWNGQYEADSTGAPAFEIVMFELAPELLKKAGLGHDGATAVLKSPNASSVLLRQLRALDAKTVGTSVRRSLRDAHANLERYPRWQDMHRVQAAHVLGKIPLLGTRWRYDEFGHGGGADTLFKTAGPRSRDKATAFYGSSARHISDMSDPDENYFVLFGGQDGWMRSEHTLDQVDLWRRFEYIKLPLTPKARTSVFTRTLKLSSAP